MSSRQCPECKATVDETKAYCPDCGTPMDEEEKRVGSSEFDSLGHTQRLSKTTQFRLLEEFNISSVFSPPQVNEAEAKAGQSEEKAVQINGHQQSQIEPNQPRKAAPKPGNIINVKAENDSKTGIASNSNKKLYVVGGILLLFTLIILGVTILGVLYWNYQK